MLEIAEEKDFKGEYLKGIFQERLNQKQQRNVFMTRVFNAPSFFLYRLGFVNVINESYPQVPGLVKADSI